MAPFEDLLERLATEHNREICELRAEIARLSQFQEENGSLQGVNDVGGNEYEDAVVWPQPDPSASEPLDAEVPTYKTGVDEEALAAAFAVATDLSTDKELMKSMHVWPDDECTSGRATKTYNESRPEALGLWEQLLKHVRREVYMSELPGVHPHWNFQDNTGFNLKNLIGGANKKLSALPKSDTMVDKAVMDQSKERLVEMFVILWRVLVPEIPLNPSSRVRLTWDFFGFLLLLHDLIMAPMDLAFNNHEVIGGMPQSYAEFTKVFDMLSAVYWTTDIIMSFLTAYFSNSGIIEKRMSYIAVHYLRTWFPIDFSIVCIDLGVIIIMGRSQGGLRTIKTMSRAMRITRLLRFAKMSRHVAELMARINSEYILQVVGLLRLLVLIIVLNHYIACTWFYLATLVENHMTWADYSLARQGHTDLAYAYFSSLHWSMTQFTPASMEIFPQNVYERMFNCLVIMFAFVFFSSFVSSITNAMTHIRNINAQAVARDSMIRRFFSDNNISHGLAARVWHFVRHKRVVMKKLKTDEVPILQQLPVRIRDELKCEVYAPILSRHPLLSYYLTSCPAAMRKICKKAISEVTVPMGKEYKYDDENKKMIFIQSGTLEFHMYDVVENEDESGILLEPGDWCCEAALWADTLQLDGHFVAAAGGSDLVLLDAEAFRTIAVENFETVDVLVKYSSHFIQRFRQAMQDSSSVKDNLLFNRRDIIKEIMADVTHGTERRSILSAGLSVTSSLRGSRGSTKSTKSGSRGPPKAP